MTKIAFAAAMAMTAIVIGAHGAQAQQVDADVNVQVNVRVGRPTAQRVCNEYTCWIVTDAAPRRRETEESVEKYRRREVIRY